MQKIENIDARTLKKRLEEDRVVLLDVREPDEYRHEHIRQAVNLPLSSFAGQNVDCPEGKEIVLHCQSGNRSMQAARMMAEKGHAAPLYSLAGGIQDWKKAGLKTISSENAVLPLQRQVQIAVGSLVLLTTVLGYFVHPAFLLVTAFLGGGLLNAGLTGWCGLAKLLAFMPWNKSC